MNNSFYFQLRRFDPDRDYDMIRAWFKGHPHTEKLEAPPKEILPPLGCVVYRVGAHGEEDIAASWLYLAQGSPVCFFDHVITKPGLRASTASRALLISIEHFKATALGLGYALMITHTIAPIARYLRREGWRQIEGEWIAMYTTCASCDEAVHQEATA